MILIIAAVLVGILLFKILKKASSWGDDAYGTLEIREKHPLLWRIIITPVRWVLRIIGLLVLLGMGWVGVLVLTMWAGYRLLVLAARWHRFMGHGDVPTMAGFHSALQRSAMRLAVERSITTVGLETKRAGATVRPVVLDVTEVARPDGRAYGHRVVIMSATGGGSLKQIQDMIGKTLFDDAWTSEVRANLWYLAGFRYDMRHRRLFGMFEHPMLSYLAFKGQLPSPKRSKMIVTADHEAGEGDLMVVYDDPLADYLPYPYQPGWWAWHYASQNDPRPLGRWEDGTETTMKLTERRVLNQGAPGSGKSSWMDASLRYDVECFDVFTVYIDLKGGMHGWVWEEGVGLFISRPDDVVRFFEYAYEAMYREMNRYMGVKSKKTSGDHTDPYLRIYVDEPTELPAALLEKRKVSVGGEQKETIIFEDMLRLMRALGMDSWLATQHASSERFPRGALVSMDTRITCRMVDQAGAQNSQGGTATGGVSAASIPDHPKYKGTAVLSDEGGLARMAKGYFASDDAERLEASRVSALRTYKPQDIWGFREATFKGRKIIPIGTPGPAVPPPLVQIAPPPPPQQPQLDLPEEDGWDDDDQDLVAEIWEALDFIATAATGPKTLTKAEHFINDNGTNYEKAVKRAKGNLSPSRGGNPARYQDLLHHIQIINNNGGLTIAKANGRPKATA